MTDAVKHLIDENARLLAELIRLRKLMREWLELSNVQLANLDDTSDIVVNTRKVLQDD